MNTFSLIREIRELKNQLSYSKNIGFFFGAGTSCALGVPNIADLTAQVATALDKDNARHFESVKTDLESLGPSGCTANIEGILDHVRRIREITGEKVDKAYQGISGNTAKNLDVEICKKIYGVIQEAEKKANLDTTKRLFAWLCMQNRDCSKEVFTTNYDLVIEKSLEGIQMPYFDGFVGSYEPFFWQDSIESFVHSNDLTSHWIRVWKIHGSLSWFWKRDPKTNTDRIVRLGLINEIDKVGKELVIYPSKEKYDTSRKQPFIAYFDRLRNFLLNGELLFIFTGYSFSDQHINEIVFNCLRQNSRLSVLVFLYQDSEVEKLASNLSSYLNVLVFGPTKAVVNGTLGDWNFNIKTDLKPGESAESFWDDSEHRLTLGDFNQLSNFIVLNSGKPESIEAIANAK